MRRLPAVIGIGAVNALGVDVAAIWSAMAAGTCGVRRMERFPRGVFMTDFAAEVTQDDEAQLRLREDCPGGGRAHLYALAAGRQALRMAGAAEASHIGLVLSTTKAELTALERLAGSGDAPDESYNPFCLAHAIARDLGCGGAVLAVSSACASGLVAIATGARILARGEAQTMLVIGVDVLAEFLLAGFSALAALSPRPCRPYDESRDGLSLGEGAGAVVMTTAQVPPARALAYVAGWGVTNDANHITAPSRSGEGLVSAMSGALSMAGLGSGDIECINGHGTATLYNDLMEAKALYELFGDDMPPIASMKGYFGHTLGAAGVIEVALSIVAMREKMAAGCLGLGHQGVERRLNVRAHNRSVERMAHLLSIKCGFGGINAAVVLSEEQPVHG
jgi:3-oxoacyl-(acyl-carrier-protein) synthase